MFDALQDGQKPVGSEGFDRRQKVGIESKAPLTTKTLETATKTAAKKFRKA
jgi:hypothetical protein